MRRLTFEVTEAQHDTIIAALWKAQQGASVQAYVALAAVMDALRPKYAIKVTEDSNV